MMYCISNDCMCLYSHRFNRLKVLENFGFNINFIKIVSPKKGIRMMIQNCTFIMTCLKINLF